MSENQQLAKIDPVIANLGRARAALAAANSIQAKHKLFSLADAAKVYARRQGLSHESIQFAHSVKIEALGDLGKLLKAAEKANGGDAQRTRYRKGTESPKTLAAHGIDKKTSALAQKISDLPDQLREDVRAGKTSVSLAIKKATARKRGDDLEAARRSLDKAVTAGTLSEVFDARHCSYAQLIPQVTPDAIITDPPYPKEFLPLYGEFARLSKGVPLVAVMCGQSYLPDVIALMSAHLNYRWTLAYLTPGGQAVQQFPAKVNTFWKPVLLFGEAADWFGDVANSRVNDNDKRHHEWGQSESGMYDLVQRLVKPGSLICDPFMGAGTTAIAALKHGCRFVGCDVNADHVATATRRVATIYG